MEAAKTAERMGGRSFQYFPKNPRSLAVKSFDRRDAEACAAYCRDNRLLSIAHAPYPTNLATDDGEKRETVIRSILNDLAIADACGSVGLIVHFGVYKGPDPLQGYIRIVNTLNVVLHQWDGNAMILIENQSGEHARMGMTLEELTQIRSLTAAPERIGFCLDSCHMLASGLWDGHNWQEVVDKGHQLGYWPQLKAVHLNDSVYPTRSFKDRHANIGQGEIGRAGLLELLHTPMLQGIPIVLETPTPEPGTHEQEIRLLQQWMSE